MRGLGCLVPFVILVVLTHVNAGLFHRSSSGGSSFPYIKDRKHSGQNREWASSSGSSPLDLSLPQSSSPQSSVGSGSNMNDIIVSVLNVVGGIAAALIWASLFKNLARGVDENLNRVLGGLHGASLHSNSSTALGQDSVLAKYLPNVTLSTYEMEIAATLVDPDSVETSLQDIGGLRDVKRSLMDSTATLVDDSIEGLPGLSTQGVLLYGPPGCGKSAIARALARQRNLPIVPLMPSSLLRKYVGETSLLTRAVFTLCSKLAPCILFIDECDSLFRNRQDDDNSVDRTLRTEIMQLWDELSRSDSRVLVIGATNRPQDIDPAIQRRFERSYLIGLPNEQAREEIFRAILRTTVLDPSFDLGQCAKATEGYSPSDIKNICKAAAQIPVREYIRNSKHKGIAKSTGAQDNVGSENGQVEAIAAASSRKPQPKLRPLRFSDISEVLRTVFPTSWTSNAYNNVLKHGGNNQFQSFKGQQQQQQQTDNRQSGATSNNESYYEGATADDDDDEEDV